MLTKFCFCAFCSLDEAADALLRILDQEDVLQEPGTRSNDAGIQVDPEVGECALFVEGQDVARVATLAPGGGHPPAQRGRLRISSEDYEAEEPHVGNVHIHLQDSPRDEAERGSEEGHARAGR